MNVRRVRIALWSVIAVLMIFLAFTYYSARKGNEIEPVKLGVPFSLIDQNGAPITEAAFQGHPTVLFFGFTHC
ncbi:UNVERIFIED_CONTAM: SCO family protein, partial [Salmonella enterica subsp. enterica serovar Enteritidis]